MKHTCCDEGVRDDLAASQGEASTQLHARTPERAIDVMDLQGAALYDNRIGGEPNSGRTEVAADGGDAERINRRARENAADRRLKGPVAGKIEAIAQLLSMARRSLATYYNPI